MHIVVCIKQVPETRDVAVDEETGVLLRDGVKSIMNPFDLYALEAALRLKEERGGSVSVISMGPPQAEAVIREAYMMGADRGYLLTDRAFAGADTLATAFTLAQGIDKIGEADLIVCGLQTTDGDTAQVGPGIAEMLRIPHESNVIAITGVTDSGLRLERDSGDSLDTVDVAFPCLITVTKAIGETRLLSFRRKLETADYPVVYWSLGDLGENEDSLYGLKGSPTQVERIFSPPTQSDQEMWRGSGSELAQRLLSKLSDLRFVGGMRHD